MMKQFGRTTLPAMGLAVAAAMLSSIPAQAAGSSVVAHALVPSVNFFTTDGSELVEVSVISTNAGYALIYSVSSFDGGGFTAGGFGPIPASSVNVSGGSVDSGNVTVMLSVNTCGLTDLTTSGPCGNINVTWVEAPVSVGGSSATRGDSRMTFASGGTVVTNGETETFPALTTGTVLGFDLSTPTLGSLVKQTNVTVTVTHP